MRNIILLLPLLYAQYVFGQNNSANQLGGYVKDSSNYEVLSFSTVKNIRNNQAITSNAYGFFSIPANVGDSIHFSFVGYKSLKIRISSLSQLQQIQTFYLIPDNNLLDEVTVTAQKEELFDKATPGKIRLTAKTIKEIPMLLGEKDPVKALQFLPGIQEVSEGSASLSVRGGDVNQNLMLLDEAVVYNANHLFGFFSTFNADAVTQLDAYKGAFPAQYGGRLSSVIDVRMRDGNKKELKGEGGIGLIASRLLLEGPIIKDKASFLISGRRTYADLLLLPFQNEREKTGYHFGDLNAKLHFNLNETNDLFFSFYTGKDKFYQKNKIPRRAGVLLNNTLLDWQNYTITSRWNKVYSSRLFQNTSLIYTQYRMNYQENTRQDYLTPPRFQEVKLHSGIEDISLKTGFDYFINNDLQIKWGGILTRHHFNPREFGYQSSRAVESFINHSDKIQTTEAAAYLNLKGNKKYFFFDAGLRLSYFSKPDYFRPEPRLILGKFINPRNTLSLSYSRMNQYLHQISNTGNGLPTDVWIPATENLKGSQADLLSTSYVLTPVDGFALSFEAYYKWIRGNTNYKSGANFLGIGQGAATTPFEWEKSLTQGRAWNYGYEITLQKTKGRLTGLGGYTLAWSISQFDDLNNGKPFYNRQDRRHIFEASVQYKASKRIALASNFIFATGNAIPMPEKLFFREDRFNNYLEAYSGMNAFRAENYHRLDVSVNLKNKKGNGSWEFGVYNVYFRKNPYNYDVYDKINTKDRTQYVTVSRQWLLPVIPSVTYNFKF
jgi:hypothetical protein